MTSKHPLSRFWKDLYRSIVQSHTNKKYSTSQKNVKTEKKVYVLSSSGIFIRLDGIDRKYYALLGKILLLEKLIFNMDSSKTICPNYVFDHFHQYATSWLKSDIFGSFWNGFSKMIKIRDYFFGLKN